MRKPRKILFVLVSLSGIFLCLLIVLVIVTPRLIKLDVVKEKIKTQYAKDIGGQIEYQYLNLALFPRPHVVISGVNFTIPEYVDGTLESLDVYPKILPLFTGELQIGTLRSRWTPLLLRPMEPSWFQPSVPCRNSGYRPSFCASETVAFIFLKEKTEF
jgi:hypothetical protein